jgi:histidine triad (HIT) family protein
MTDTNEKEEKDCVFCKIISGDIKAEIIAEEDNFIIMNDKFPKTKGHCLIIPKKHYTTLLDIPSSLGTELISLVKKQGLRLMKENKSEGFNLIQNNFSAAGQVVMHAHFHVIPRKAGDSVKL